MGDLELGYKECFRVFSKDEDGCIPADEIKFVLMHLPGKITYREIDEMIATVDKNEDWKISYSEFRVMLGAFPLVLPDFPVRVRRSDSFLAGGTLVGGSGEWDGEDGE